MNRTQPLLQRGLQALDPWLDAAFPIATTLICSRARLAGYSLLVVHLLLRLLQRSDREPWRWILISLLVVNAGLIIEDRDFKPGGPSDYLVAAVSFAAGLQRSRISWRTSFAWIAACTIPLLGLSLAAGEKMIQLNSSFTGFNINRIGFLAGLLSIVSYSLFKNQRNPTGRIAAAALLAGGFTEALLTQSRAAIAVPVIAIAADLSRHINWTQKKAALAVAAITAASLLTFYSWYSGAPEESAAIADENRIETIRCWISNTTKTSSNFFFGQGYGKAPSKKCGPSLDASLKGRDTPLAHAHNLYIQLFGETGIMGLALGVGLTIQAVRKSWSVDPGSNDLTTRPLIIYLLLMAMGSTWHSMLLNQVLVGYSLAALTAMDRDPAAADATIPKAPQGASEPPG